MKLITGYITPNQNKRCVVTGRLFGPTQRQKTGRLVTVHTDDGKIFNYPVYGTREVEAMVENIKKEKKDEEIKRTN